MTAFFVALLLSQSSAHPVGWMVMPPASQAKVDASPLRNWLLRLNRPPGNDTLYAVSDVNGEVHVASVGEESMIKDSLGKVGAEQLPAQPDLMLGFDPQQLAATQVPNTGHFDGSRALQRLAVDKLGVLVLGAKFTGKDAVHVEGLMPYPPPRSGFVEALGPAAPAIIPANAPQADTITMISVRPSAVFNQANLALAAASPVDQALFYTHLKGLEAQLGKRFADDALGAAPRTWSAYERGGEGVTVLEVADIGLVKVFADRYVEALAALAPGSKVERSKSGKRDVIAVTLPSKETLALAFDTNALVVAPTAKALNRHFAAKARGKATTLTGNGVVWGSLKNQATYLVTLTDDGFKVTADAKAKK